MNDMFKGATSFNQNLNSWNVSSLKETSGMFNDASSFNGDISSWITSSIYNMDLMFYNATSFNRDLSGWCVSLIPSLPTDFDTGATSWVLSRPVWGTCP
jgi:surface protein